MKKSDPSNEIEETIRLLARDFGARLKKAIDARLIEMVEDDRSHALIYQVLGITDQEGRLVDEYQNKGRFLYKYGLIFGSGSEIVFPGDLS